MEKKYKFELTSFALHSIAMFLMLLDHLWGTWIIPIDFLTIVGRIAFPIFAFLSVEGYFHTHDHKKYMLRLLALALISEIPFDLMVDGVVFNPFHQNVIWTFLLGHLMLSLTDKVREKFPSVTGYLLSAGVMVLGFILGTITFVDYFGYGILCMFVFYWFRGENRIAHLGQLIGLVILFVFMFKGRVYDLSLFGKVIEFPQEGFAVLSLPLIWMYHGKHGYFSRFVQTFNYLFYPGHMLLLYLIIHFFY